MYLLNKIVWFFFNPLTLPFVCACVGAAMFSRRRRLGAWMLGLSLAVLWFQATPACMFLLGLPLERPYLASQSVASLPAADAAVVLGGGMGKVDTMEYPDMNEAADRVWHAARIWKAGKAPVVVVSGSNDLAAAVPLLVDLGVPREAIAVDDKSRNTYENSRFTERLLLDGAAAAGASGESARAPSVLLVTSAWHMPRASGNFAKTSLRVVPAPCDFWVSNAWEAGRHWWEWVAPSADVAKCTSYMFKEWLGRLARK